MKQLTVELRTGMSVRDCAMTFRESVEQSYGAGRKLLRGIAAVAGRDTGGIEFFEPSGGGVFDQFGEQPDWKAGALVPGHNKMNGATKMAVQIYVVDTGATRDITLIAPYSMGDRGSTERLLHKIAGSFT